MKKLIAFIIMLTFASVIYADDYYEETVCVPNKAGGVIHLRKNMTVIGSSSNEVNATYVTGHWELAGNTLVMITWDDNTHTALPKSVFVSCNL